MRKGFFILALVILLTGCTSTKINSNSIQSSNVPVTTVDTNSPTSVQTYVTKNKKYSFSHSQAVQVTEDNQARSDLFESYIYLKLHDQTVANIILHNASNTKYKTLDDYSRGERLDRADLTGQLKEPITVANNPAYKFKLSPYGDTGPFVITKINNQFILFMNKDYNEFDRLIESFKVLKN